jgi:hypothetical protein
MRRIEDELTEGHEVGGFDPPGSTKYINGLVDFTASAPTN